MIKDLNELKKYLSNLRSGDYQRINFDNFLHKIRFDYNVPTIHISGSNGKGSTLNYLNNIYMDSKYKVGVFHSPYYLNMDEMILINNQRIDLSYIDKIINQYDKYIKKYNLSEFELETFIALNYFKDNNVDIAIIECGMGGEEDATNVFDSIISIITSISLEHTTYLGSSITEIAKAKAGIIKENSEVIIGKLDEEASQVIAHISALKHSVVYKCDPYYNAKIVDNRYHFDTTYYNDLIIPSTAIYSIVDAMIALKTIQRLNQRFNVDESNIRQGLLNSFLIGRMNIINDNPLVIIDGGHNPEAIKQLCDSIEILNVNNKEIHVIFASFLDKNIQNMLGTLNFLSKNIYLTTFDHPRARKEEDYLMYLEDYKYYENPIELYNNLKEQYPEDIILICGSLAFSFYMIDKIKGDKNE